MSVTHDFRSRLAAAVALSVMATACGGSKTDAPAEPTAAAQTGTPPAVQADARFPATPPPAGPSEVSILDILAKNPGPDAVIATVNGAPVRSRQVDAAFRMYRRALRARGQTLTPEDEKNLKVTSFRAVITDELLTQAALKAGIKVSPADVDKALAQAKARMGTPQEWEQFMKESNISAADLRVQAERNLVNDAYRKQLTASKPVTEAQARAFYDQNQETFKVPESVHALLILLPVIEREGAPSKTEAKRLADEARGKAAAGEDFASLARQYSQDASAQAGGDVGWVPRGVLVAASEQAVFGLKNGEISPVLETPKGYMVFKVLERKPESIAKFDEVKQALLQDMSRLMMSNILEEKVKELSEAADIIVADPRPDPTATAGK
jgi:peptidyl-prolyl cis-trans isomerase C